MRDPNSEFDSIEAGLTAMHRASFQHKSWESLQREFDLSIDRASAALLVAVAMCKDKPCRMQDLARYLGIEAPSVTRTAQGLEEAGLLTRHQDSEDRRASNIELTADGVKLLKRLKAAKRLRLKQALNGWSSADRDELARLLLKLADAYDKLNNIKEEKHAQ